MHRRRRGAALTTGFGPASNMLGRAYRGRLFSAAQAAFTLVEVLVVMAVISILLAMLAPSLSDARSRAREVVCAARLRQWGVAFSCYATENEGWWPHCDGLERKPRPRDDPRATREDVADWFGWMDVLPPLIEHKPWRDYAEAEHPDGSTFYQCPAARLVAPAALYGYYPLRNGYFSYAMNSCLELDANAYAPPAARDYPMPSFLDTARIQRPADVVLLFDQLLDPCKGYDGNYPYRACGQYSGSYPIAFSARHARRGSQLGGNLLFGDGHVNWQKSVWKAHWGEWNIGGRQQSPPRDDPNWYPYPDRTDW